MEKQHPTKVRFVFHKGSMKMKFIILVAVILATLTLGALRRSIQVTRRQYEYLRSQAISLEQEKRELQENIRTVSTADGITRIAQEELGLVSPDTILFKSAPGN